MWAACGFVGFEFRELLDVEVADPNSNVVDVGVVKAGAGELAVDKGASAIPWLPTRFFTLLVHFVWLVRGI